MILTELPEVSLRPLEGRHAETLLRLLQENRVHLTAYGDYQEQVRASLEALHSELSTGNELRFGIFVRDELAGRIDLVPVNPPRFGLGYWLDRNATGQGYATAAVRALIEYARHEHGAAAIYAGVTHGNEPSQAVLIRCGFKVGARFDNYTRFHLPLR